MMEEREVRTEQKSFATRVKTRLTNGAASFTEPLVVLRGQREATVYGCRKILLYTPPEIRLRMRKKHLCILGEGLCCTSFSGGTVTVEGKIDAIRYVRETEERIEA